MPNTETFTLENILAACEKSICRLLRERSQNAVDIVQKTPNSTIEKYCGKPSDTQVVHWQAMALGLQEAAHIVREFFQNYRVAHKQSTENAPVPFNAFQNLHKKE